MPGPGGAWSQGVPGNGEAGYLVPGGCLVLGGCLVPGGLQVHNKGGS